MFNISGMEFLVIALVALLVLGPEKLPEAARKAGRVVSELRRMSSGFQAEMRDAFVEPIRTITDTTDTIRQSVDDTIRMPVDAVADATDGDENQVTTAAKTGAAGGTSPFAPPRGTPLSGPSTPPVPHPERNA
ncbi:MAG: Sec-independent protein translocase protein TatB [Acidimicrobiia bacterium]